MIALLPQTGQRHRNAKAVAAWLQSQLVSGCFIGGTLLVGYGRRDRSNRARSKPSSKDSAVSAIRLADHAIRRAMTSPNSCQAEIAVALNTLRYMEQALQREGDELKITIFAVMDPMQTVDSLKNLTGTAFSDRARNALEALKQLEGICGCPGASTGPDDA
jgi:hypothetical protein